MLSIAVPDAGINHASQHFQLLSNNLVTRLKCMLWILIMILCVVAFIVSKFVLLCCLMGYRIYLGHAEVFLLAKIPKSSVFIPGLFLSKGNNNWPVVVVVVVVVAAEVNLLFCLMII